MKTLDVTTPTPGPRVGTRWLATVRVVMAVVGAQLLAGAVYFTFFATPAEGGVVGAFDWFVAGWAFVAALGLIGVASLPFPSPGRRVQAAWWVLGVHALWALVKVVAYDEMPVSGIVLGIDVVVALLLWQATRPEPAVAGS